jgi:branched-chain amino acid transport system substrate-binding protein
MEAGSLNSTTDKMTMTTNKSAFRIGALVAGAVLSAPLLAADLKVGFITSLSGPVAALGVPYNKGIEAAQTFKSTIGGRKVQVIVLDDASDPATAARNARKLVNEEKVDVLIGTSGVPGAMAIAAVARETHTPLISPTPVTVPADDGGWTVSVSQSFPLMVSAVVDKMKANGVKTVAFIGFSDALGDQTLRALEQAAGPAGIKIVASERYARGDSSVAGQVLKIVAARPDAVFAGNSGTPGALPFLGLAERGYKGGLYGTHGLVNAEFVRIVGKAGNGLLVPSGPVTVAEQLPASNPVRKVAMDFREAYHKKFADQAVDPFSAYTFDAWLVFADAATRVGNKAEPGTPAYRQALHDAIAQTHELVGAHGVFNFKPNEPDGLDRRAAVMIRLDNGQWKLAQ